MFVTVIPD